MGAESEVKHTRAAHVRLLHSQPARAHAFTIVDPARTQMHTLLLTVIVFHWEAVLVLVRAVSVILLVYSTAAVLVLQALLLPVLFSLALLIRALWGGVFIQLQLKLLIAFHLSSRVLLFLLAAVFVLCVLLCVLLLRRQGHVC